MKSWFTLEIEKGDMDTKSTDMLNVIVEDMLDTVQAIIMDTMVEKQIPTSIKITNMERDT